MEVTRTLHQEEQIKFGIFKSPGPPPPLLCGRWYSQLPQGQDSEIGFAINFTSAPQRLPGHWQQENSFFWVRDPHLLGLPSTAIRWMRFFSCPHLTQTPAHLQNHGFYLCTSLILVKVSACSKQFCE